MVSLYSLLLESLNARPEKTLQETLERKSTFQLDELRPKYSWFLPSSSQIKLLRAFLTPRKPYNPHLRCFFLRTDCSHDDESCVRDYFPDSPRMNGMVWDVLLLHKE